ncbi:class I SAM-dependent methyltransferase [Massilia sp. CT11-137]|uniref:class I SAM-dependent methyltransferase n=1 Tax=Massilia sp. CT11-137 TaxID=3393901 RepID=UPI0039A72B32
MTDYPSTWVARWAPVIPAGETLDLACGGGRHARLLAALGHPVLAVDRDAASLAQAAGPGIATLQHDLEAEGSTWPFAPGRFAGIVVTNYLHRPLFAHLAGALAPNGILVYETFALGNERFGKPSNPAFLLAPGELLDVAARHGLKVLAYEDGIIESPRPARVQRLCAAGREVDPGAIRLDM